MSLREERTVLDCIVRRGDLTFLKSRPVPLLAPHFEPLKRFVVVERVVVLLLSFGVQLAFVPLSLWCEVGIDTKNRGGDLGNTFLQLGL